ncbi:biofilm regulation protein phosphatase SiaA [Dechloromonas sp. ZY10]|uniref:biofilm regulation protein phosphatase SiaA n=1 Tax=Dechloromonas aquae TaxID=2664436 RepID=UPI003528B21F
MLTGLRARTTLLLLVITLIVAVAAIAIGRQTLNSLRHDLGSVLVRDHARVVQQRIQSRVGLELALSQRLAASSLLHEWLANETSEPARRRFIAEAEGFRQAFSSHSYFVASETSRNFSYSDNNTGSDLKQGYQVKEDKPENAWYFATLREKNGYWINVDFDKTLGLTNIWINVAVQDSTGKALGVIGTGINLNDFLREVLSSSEPGLTTMVVDRKGNIVAHPDVSQMQFDLAATRESEKTIFRLLKPDAAAQVRTMIAAEIETAAGPSTMLAELNEQPRLLAIAMVPSLGWSIIAALDMESGSLLSPLHLSGLLIACALLLMLLLAASTLGVDSLILRPLLRLSESARRMANGNYEVELASTRTDELGQLTRVFDQMAAQVRTHSQNLEQQVAQRTSALATTNRKLTDSIRYASLIQRALLPDSALCENFGDEHFVLWRPRDVVGGDLYFYRCGPQGQLLGVIDCAGHGVPGACMTMITHATLEMTLADTPWQQPAELLKKMDERIRKMLSTDQGQTKLATSIDLGICHIAPDRQHLHFAGAGISLVRHDPEGTHWHRGERRALNDRKPGTYAAETIPLSSSQTIYLTTDGLLDQAGGDAGYAFGETRLRAWITENSHRSMPQQLQALQSTLASYQADEVQRDDITVLAFRLHPPQ